MNPGFGSDFEDDKPKKTKQREPTPEELTEETTFDSVESEHDTPNTSIDEESSISMEKPIKPRGRPRKSISATPQPKEPRTQSAQPKKVKSTPSSSAVKPAAGVRGRKPKLSVVPETQMEISIFEGVDEVEDVELVELVTRPRQGSILPASVTRKASFDV